jgi:hypothetical protein
MNTESDTSAGKDACRFDSAGKTHAKCETYPAKNTSGHDNERGFGIVNMGFSWREADPFYR